MDTLSDTYNKAVWVAALAKVIVLRSWAANFTIAMSLALSQVYTDGYQRTVRIT